jgi:hypothetical protein
MSLRAPIFEGDGFAIVQYVLDNEARVTLEFWGPELRFRASEGRLEVSMPHAVWEQLHQHAAQYAPGEWIHSPITEEEEAEWAERDARKAERGRTEPTR